MIQSIRSILCSILHVYSPTPPLEKELSHTISRLRRLKIQQDLHIIEESGKAAIIQSKLDYLEELVLDSTLHTVKD